LSYGFKVMVESDYACFTRPEMKVERVSYDVPTPSALQGILKSIYWKPALKYVIDKIVVFNPIDFINIRRNEVKEKIKISEVKNQMKGGSANPGIYTKECINQRAGMILKNVRYGIEFHFEMTGIKNEHDDECEEKHYNILLRRLKNGQCFRQPVMGCREFSVRKIELVHDFCYEEISPELQGERDLGYMLYEMKYQDGGRPVNDDWEHPRFSDNADAVYYRPVMINGVIDVETYRRDIRC
jgi:CRISPR-associated protein Cas5d